MAIVTTDIVNEFGAFYLDHGQGVQNFVNEVLFANPTGKTFTQITTNDTIYRVSPTVMGDVTQPFQKDFTPKGDATFSGKTIDLYKIKVDVTLYPDDVEDTWMGFLASNSLDRRTWPVVRYIIEQMIMPKFNNNMELAEIYNGEPAAITPGTAGNTGASMLGLRKQINDDVTATNITTITTGAPSATATTWCEQVEAFCRAIPEQYWMEDHIPIHMSPELHQRYRDGKREKYNQYYAQETELDRVADMNFRVAPSPAMTGSTKIFTTPRRNIFDIRKRSPIDRIPLDIEKVDRQVKIYGDFWRGVGYAKPEEIWTNDQDL